MNGYERRKDRKRSQIVGAAERLLSQRGFSGVSVSEIARDAGVSQVTIYNHFGDKRGLVRAAVLAMTERKLSDYRHILTSDEPWMNRLRSVITDKKRSFRDLAGVFLDGLYQEYPDILNEVRDLQNRVREEIMYPFLDEGRDLGCIPAHISNDAISSYLLIIAKGFDRSPELVRELSETPTLFDQVYELLVFGLVTAGPDGPA
jgi:AcrR family transcriptional regulator